MINLLHSSPVGFVNLLLAAMELLTGNREQNLLMNHLGVLCLSPNLKSADFDL